MNKKLCLLSSIFVVTLSISFLGSKKERVGAASIYETMFSYDYDGDGIKEYMYKEFSGIVSKEQRFLYDSSDLTGLAEYSSISLENYGYSQVTYDTLEQACYDAEDYFSEIEQTYDSTSPEYINASNAIDEAYLAFEEYDNFLAECQNKVDQDYDKLAAKYGIKIKEAVNPNKTVVTTYIDTLKYWLHIPYNYNPNKSYPILVWCPGSGGTQSAHFNSDGTYKSNKTLEPGDAWWCSSVFNCLDSAIKSSSANEDKYDCFIIHIYPDSNWTGSVYNTTYKKACLSLTNFSSYPKTGAISLTSEVTGDGSYSSSYRNTYIASMTAPSRDSQLVTQLIDDLMTKYNIDPRRQYISGGSLGGAFTMDTINHYPNRFACAIPLVPAASDCSLENASHLLNMNIWSIGGSSDKNVSKYHNKFFVNAINEARSLSKETTYGKAQYSIFSGGHSCGYFSNTLRSAIEGTSITVQNQILDFMFDSVRQDMNIDSYKMDHKEVNKVETDIISSLTLDNDTYDVALISSTPIIDNYEYGFYVEVSDSLTTKYKLIPVNKHGSIINTTLGNTSITINSNSYGCYDMYSYTINDVPRTITNIKFKSYIKNNTGYIYGKTNSYNVEIENNNVRMVKAYE